MVYGAPLLVIPRKCCMLVFLRKELLALLRKLRPILRDRLLFLIDFDPQGRMQQFGFLCPGRTFLNRGQTKKKCYIPRHLELAEIGYDIMFWSPCNVG